MKLSRTDERLMRRIREADANQLAMLISAIETHAFEYEEHRENAKQLWHNRKAVVGPAKVWRAMIANAEQVLAHTDHGLSVTVKIEIANTLAIRIQEDVYLTDTERDLLVGQAKALTPRGAHAQGQSTVRWTPAAMQQPTYDFPSKF